MTGRWCLAAVVGFVVSCLLLGGGARQGYLSDAILQLCAIPLLLASLARVGEDRLRVDTPFLFCCAVALIPLLQLLPLPPQIWKALPLRDLAEQTLRLADQQIGWRPLSLTPHATWLALLSLLPPFAIFASVRLLTWQDRSLLVMALLLISIVIAVFGLLHIAAGGAQGSPQSTAASASSALAVFANRNHFAALLYCALLLTAAFAVENGRKAAMAYTNSRDSRLLVGSIICFAVIVTLLAALMMSRSRAGVGLAIVAVLAVAALANSEKSAATALSTQKLLLAAVMLVLIFASQFALYRVMERWAVDPLQDARLGIARNTTTAAWQAFPWGTGLGSFVPVYQIYETPDDVIPGTFINRAHNEILELWLETGVAGLVVLAAFLVWLSHRLWCIWWKDEVHGSPLDRSLQRTASLVVVLLLAHSLVDYPLRTTALMAVFAMCCAFLCEPLGRSDRSATATQGARATAKVPLATKRRHPQESKNSVADGKKADPSRTHHWNWPDTPVKAADAAKRLPPEPASTDAVSEKHPRPSGVAERWGDEVEWPSDWRTKGNGTPPSPKKNDSETP